jgi:hypothetical protein
VPKVDYFLLVLPEQHYLSYGSCVIRDIVNRYAKTGQTVVELPDGSANPETIDQAIADHDPILICATGHGNSDVFTVECKTVYMRSGDARVAKMSNRVVHLISCLTAGGLGPSLINAGALTYFGCMEEFNFYIGSGPCSDRASMAVFLPELQVEASLLSGKTTGEARADQLSRYDEEIEYWFRGVGSTHPDAAVILRCLEIDRDISTMLGRSDIKVTTAVSPPVVGMGTALLAPVAMAFGMIAFGSSKGSVI